MSTNKTDRHPRAFAAGFGVALALAAIVGAVALGGLPGGGTEDRVAELEAEFAERDAETLTALTERAEEAAADLGPTLEEMGRVLLPDAAPPEPPGDAVARWRDQVAFVEGSFAPEESAGTGINIARNAFDVAVGQLARAIDLIDDGDLALALDVRDDAVRTWAIGATQLDLANVEAGNGHRHAYLPVQVDGAITADAAPVGSR